MQGPDGDEITINGQKGIQNNVSIDGADANNPFFGEQRGGQRPAFTFNLDAVQDFVVVSDGANAEFLLSGMNLVNKPRFSPSTQTIIFTAWVPNPRNAKETLLRTYLYDIETGHVETLEFCEAWLRRLEGDPLPPDATGAS